MDIEPRMDTKYTININPEILKEWESKMDSQWQYFEAKEILKENVVLQTLAESAKDAFYVVNLMTLRAKHQQWLDHLPRVDPFYAVKCNPDPRILETLSSVGAGFDCASIAEIEAALKNGATANRIIYANPCKPSHHLEAARNLGVNLTTFDSCSELLKIAKVHPDMGVILRILVDDSNSVCQMGGKYGAKMQQVPQLLDMAKELGLNVRGVSYHVGSGCQDATSFGDAVKLARHAFDIAYSKGMRLDILDIGGGFPGQFIPSDRSAGGVSFDDISSTLRPALDQYFPASSGVRIISEPGRYYATSTHTLATKVIGRREPNDYKMVYDEKKLQFRAQPGPGYMYYINDGLYGSFNCVLYDHIDVSTSSHPKVMQVGKILPEDSAVAAEESFPCSIWGPTCDGLDCVMKNATLPILEEGDWLTFRNMGAYTNAAGSNFNGFVKPEIFYIDEE
eukprot:CAMPEP_0184481518 /NCGR_PEP_ID=MMETSP0113_2-20130426/3069_1 /TAXON_ID=91329 /ORGANISM="Norrisiella sphaerica, Strain BC52" /LENGTH=450 /DNA_ID=CAMNT_0026860689 /DNA_START=482 /DNA_END=1834 /DNA_ORIENTATION=-